MYSAELKGDDPKVTAVVSRVGTILKPDSDLLKTWCAVQKIIGVSANSRDYKKLEAGMDLALAFDAALNHSGSTTEEPDRYGRIDWRRLWRHSLSL